MSAVSWPSWGLEIRISQTFWCCPFFSCKYIAFLSVFLSMQNWVFGSNWFPVSVVGTSFLLPHLSNGIGHSRSNASCAADLGKLQSSDEWENQTDAVERYVWYCCEVAKVMVTEDREQDCIGCNNPKIGCNNPKNWLSAPANQRARVMEKKTNTCCHSVTRKVLVKEKDGVHFWK